MFKENQCTRIDERSELDEALNVMKFHEFLDWFHFLTAYFAEIASQLLEVGHPGQHWLGKVFDSREPIGMVGGTSEVELLQIDKSSSW